MRIVILGNAGSGKSTLAQTLAKPSGTTVLDLDTIFWAPNCIAVKRPAADVYVDLERFCSEHGTWIIEGCYGELARRVLALGPQFIFLNPGETVCLKNCRERPWEPHKYSSKEDQDTQLETLLAWVVSYYSRADDMSLKGHRALFESYDGPKREITAQE